VTIYLSVCLSLSSCTGADVRDRAHLCLPAQELFDDFHCALQKKILLQGRMFVFQHYVCFHANIFGYVKNKTIPLKVRAYQQLRLAAGDGPLRLLAPSMVRPSGSLGAHWADSGLSVACLSVCKSKLSVLVSANLS
jgi:GRAM domain